jgi:hypothetical protein
VNSNSGLPGRLTTVLLFVMFAIGSLGLAVPSFAQANVQGQWTTMPYTMPINPIHVALLSTGKVLIVAGSGNNPPVTNFQAAVWDPQTGTITTQSVGWDMFCNGMVVMPDGRAFINGGTIRYNPSFYGAANVSVFDPISNKFSDLPSMAHGRWYPTVTTLPDGTILSYSGLNETGATNTKVEVFSSRTGTWSPEYKSGWTPPLYPRLHVLPDGRVFYSGPTTQSRFYNPSTHTWSGVIATTNFTGRRLYGSSVLLPLTPANNYKPEVFILGGGTPATNTTELIDLSSAAPAWRMGPPMSQPRIEMNTVMLPNGKVLAIGGSGRDEVASTASLNADLYDPATNTFSSAGKNAFPRLYHSVAMLLPDATVWVAGSNPQRGTYDARMELYKPAYLFTTDAAGNAVLATRPTITSAPPNVTYGSNFTVQTPDAANISSVVLIKAGAVTHAFDMDEREVGLSYVTAGSGALTVTAPPNANIATPGYYLLFLLNSSGVPSVAKFVQVTAGADFSVTVTPPQRAVVSGAIASYSVQTVPSGGFAGSVKLTTSGVPSGAVANFSSNLISQRATTTLNIKTAGIYPATLPMTYPITVQASSGSMTRSATVSMLLNSPGGFTVSASPSSVSVPKGTTGNTTLTIVPSGGFVGVVKFAVSGLPTGVTASFSPTTVTGSGTTALALQAASTAPSGTSTITVTATSGTIVRTTTFTLTIS